jgi:hypothetical protein
MFTPKGVMGRTLTSSERSLHMLKLPPESTNSPESLLTPTSRAVAEMRVTVGAGAVTTESLESMEPSEVRDLVEARLGDTLV